MTTNKTIREPAREIPVIAETDVIVAGGGVAGIAAAVAAARNGAKTLLIERYGCLGGTMSGVPMKWVGGYNPEVHGGIVRELVEAARREKGVIREFYIPTVNGSMVGIYVDALKKITLDMIETAKVQLLLHAWAVEAIMDEGGKKLRGIIIESKSGRQAVLGKMIIDATGDGDIAALAKFPYEKGRPGDGKTQPMTAYGPRMLNVDTEKLLTFLQSYKKANPKDLMECDISLPNFTFGGFSDLLAKARKNGDIYLDYNALWVNCNHESRSVEIDGSFVPNVDGTNVFDLTHAETDSIKQVSSFEGFARKYLAGFEKSCRTDRGGFSIGVRETRRIMGQYVITEEDVAGGRSFPDGICRNTTAMDVHSPDGTQSWTPARCYEIPFRCLVPRESVNLLVAGRCVSTTHRALASVRFIPPCIGTGEAAGVAAAMAAADGIPIEKLDTQLLREKLKKQGVIL
ncbi:MAG: FAD-dependent oxidoreductase [Verrucomicrobiae bacterium]|nr:FAD-dependent oxidoreductase [Verrucomicrobiae bacterium]